MEVYKKKVEKMYEVVDSKEAYHILQDKIYRKFILDIANKKFDESTAHEIAVFLHKNVVKKDKNLWYA